MSDGVSDDVMDIGSAPKRRKTRRGKRGGKKHKRPALAEPLPVVGHIEQHAPHVHVAPPPGLPRIMGTLRSRLHAIHSRKSAHG